MVGIAQLVEHRLVAPVVAGSSPVVHPDESAPAFASGPISFSSLPSAGWGGRAWARGPVRVIGRNAPRKGSWAPRPQEELFAHASRHFLIFLRSLHCESGFCRAETRSFLLWALGCSVEIKEDGECSDVSESRDEVEANKAVVVCGNYCRCGHVCAVGRLDGICCGRARG